jgi:hypothetical protein
LVEVFADSEASVNAGRRFPEDVGSGGRVANGI